MSVQELKMNYTIQSGSNEGVWSMFHCEVSSSCFTRLLLALHPVRVGMGHLEEVQGCRRITCTERKNEHGSGGEGGGKEVTHHT